MAIYTVHLPPIEDARERAAKAVFVKDGFSRWAFVFGPLWLAWNRLWISAALALAVIAGVVALPVLLPALPGWSPPLLMLLVNSLIALEGGSLNRWRLARRGWQEAGLVAAPSLEEAERRFFSGLSVAPAARAVEPAQPAPRPVETRDVLGLFPEPGRAR